MVNIAVCDDDRIFSGQLERMLLAIADREHIAVDVDVFFRGEELADAVCSGEAGYDLIFLDIEMGGIDGLETARRIREKDMDLLLIYVTSHDRYAIEAYQVQPFQFMVKPVEEEKLARYFRKAYEKICREPSFYRFRYEKQVYRLPIREILYFESSRRVILIHMADGAVYKYYDKIGAVEERLKQEKADFWRIHQSFLANADAIIRVSYQQVELKDHTVLFISEDRRKGVSELYCDRVGDDMVE